MWRGLNGRAVTGGIVLEAFEGGGVGRICASGIDYAAVWIDSVSAIVVAGIALVLSSISLPFAHHLWSNQ